MHAVHTARWNVFRSGRIEYVISGGTFDINVKPLTQSDLYIVPPFSQLAYLLNNLADIGRLDASMAFVDSGYTLALFREIHANPDYPVALPVWSELERGSLLPPRPVKGQAGAPKKEPQARARIRGRNDNCQRGRGDGGGQGGGGGGGGGSGSGSGAIAHGMSSVRSYIGDLGVGGRAGAERPPARVWGPLAAQRYGTQDTSQRGHAAEVGGGGAGAGSNATPSLSQGAGSSATPSLSQGAGSSATSTLSQNSVDLS